MIGFGANRRGGRLPSLFLIALMVIIAILSFNYWTVTSKHVRLLDEVAEVQAQVKRTDAARIRLEKRNTELMAQVDTHKKQIDQKEGDNNVLGSKIQARETLIKKCTDDKMKLHQDFTSQITEITRLKEQLKEINQEFMQQEEQMREVRKNRTTLERRLEYESLQCGRQIKQLTEEFEESRKTLALEVAKLRRSGLDSNKLGVQAQPQAGAEVEAERHTVADLVQGNVILKGVKKAQIAPKQKEAPKEVPAAVAAVPAKGFREQALDQPLLQQDRVGLGGGAGGGGEEEEEEEEEEVQVQQQQQQQAAVAAVVVPPGHIKQPVPQAVVDKPVLFDEDNKAAMRADEFGEQNRQLQAPVNVKAESVQMKALPVPPNPAQVPKPLEPHRVKDQVPVQLPPHHQSRFFDENESPVDPQRGSKLADYNGDDGNVGEYEADKQAELAYNEEEDGDGGEEDVQDDEDRDMQGGRAGEYGKRRQAADIL
ncbi:protein GOLM2 isoform X3 [Gadus macrocephalus]|uniref:protein GOLM2 isoform X3 n=1 Tax=Gadus macrocephalus TaxID=80720 RepID=UPI0028CBA323|nr:protein GOLM2 isoform X3 [Gadus macrocephalus]